MPETSENTVPPRKTMAAWLAMAVPVLCFFTLAYCAFLVEDWSRDLSQNTAETSPQAADTRLRPLALPFPPADAAEIVRQAALERLPRWSAADNKNDGQSPGANTAADGAVTLHFVRTTPLMRYKDDVTVRIAPVGAGESLIHVKSQSRLGKGDLGQNPRNIRELLVAIQTEVASR